MDSTPPSDNRTTVGDSAGVRVVESSGDLVYGALADEPELVVGSGQGSGGLVLGYVVDALLLPEMRLAIADQLEQGVLVFDSSGQHVATWGRGGAGPGEYGMITRLDRFRGDSLLITEIGSRRLSVLGIDGAFGRLITPRLRFEPGQGTRAIVSCCSAWGAETGTGGVLLASPELVPTSGGQDRRSTVRLFRVSADGTVVPHGSFRGGRYEAVSLDPGLLPYHFNNRLSIAPREEGYAITNGLGHEVRFLGDDGRLMVVARLLRPRVAVNDRMRAATDARLAQRQAELGEAVTEASGLRQLLRQPYPDSLPAYTTLLVDDDGNVWAGSIHEPWLDQDNRFDIFSPDGSFRGSVLLPHDAAVLDIRAGHVVVSVRDDFDVQHVRVYRVVVPDVVAS